MEVAGVSDVVASVRLLGRDDVAPMRAMLAMFGEAFDEGRAYSDRPLGAAWLQRLLGSDTFIALAAIKGDEVVGGIAAYVLPKFEQERSEIYIYDLAVARAHRRQGIASAMIGRSEEHTSELQSLMRISYAVFCWKNKTR